MKMSNSKPIMFAVVFLSIFLGTGTAFASQGVLQFHFSKGLTEVVVDGVHHQAAATDAQTQEFLDLNAKNGMTQSLNLICKAHFGVLNGGYLIQAIEYTSCASSK